MPLQDFSRAGTAAAFGVNAATVIVRRDLHSREVAGSALPPREEATPRRMAGRPTYDLDDDLPL